MKPVILLCALLFNFYSIAQSDQLSGIYRCSGNDLIRLDSDGTGRMIMSYNFEGVRSFTWSYNSQEGSINIDSEPPSDLKYELLPIHITLYLRNDEGRLGLEHYTSGPTFLYLKQ